MGSAFSTAAGVAWPGFVPKYHMVRLSSVDMHRLYVPRSVTELCGFAPGDLLAFEDCTERTFKVCLESTDGQCYLGTGWAQMLGEIQCFCGDILMLHIKSVRACKAYVFCGTTLAQKYPLLVDRRFGCPPNAAVNGELGVGTGLDGFHDYVVGGGVGEGSQARPIDIDDVDDDPVTSDIVYNVSGRDVDMAMRDFFLHISANFGFRAPLYYCKFGLVETDIKYFAFEAEYGLRYLVDEISGYDLAQLHRALDDPITVALHVAEDGVVVLGHGWDLFVRTSHVPKLTELVFRFDWSDDDDGLHIFVYDF